MQFISICNIKIFRRHFPLVRLNKNRVQIQSSTFDNPITVDFPFIFDERIAKISAMMADGSLIKDLMRVFFDQKKDPMKTFEFANIIKRKFRPKSKIFIRLGDQNTLQCFINSQTLAHFFSSILDISKSDEDFKVPKWVFNSPKSVIKVFVREAFAMEGTVLEPFSHCEVRLHNNSKIFLEQVKQLLEKFEINSKIRARSDHPWKFRLFINGDDTINFALSLGSNLDFHTKRLNQILIRKGILKNKLKKIK